MRDLFSVNIDRLQFSPNEHIVAIYRAVKYCDRIVEGYTTYVFKHPSMGPEILGKLSQ